MQNPETTLAPEGMIRDGKLKRRRGARPRLEYLGLREASTVAQDKDRCVLTTRGEGTDDHDDIMPGSTSCS